MSFGTVLEAALNSDSKLYKRNFSFIPPQGELTGQCLSYGKECDHVRIFSLRTRAIPNVLVYKSRLDFLKLILRMPNQGTTF